MRENERRRILDEVAEAVHRGDPLDSYQDQVDRLVEAGMSLDAIEAEVNDRISRIQTDEEIDNLRSSVQKKGLLFGGITAVALLLLSLVGSYLLTQSMLPAPEPTHTPTPAPTSVAIAEHSVGHWRLAIDTRGVQPTSGDPTQAIVTVHVVDKGGNPAPDGLEARFSVTSGDITPRTATTRNGVLTALYTGVAGASPATLTVKMQNDIATYQISTFGSGTVVQEQTPTETPTPEMTPLSTPVTPTPEPIEVTIDWTPRYSDIIEIGVGQSLAVTITAKRQSEAVPGAELDVTAASGLVSFDGNSNASIATDETGTSSVILAASETPGEDTLQIVSTVSVTQSVQIRVLPVATILKDGIHLRTQPVMARAMWKGGIGGPSERKGSSSVILGKHPCYDSDDSISAGFDCYLVRDSNGAPYWLQGDPGTIEIRPPGAIIEEMPRDAVENIDNALTPSPSSKESSIVTQRQLRLSEENTNAVDKISLWKDSSGKVVLAELPEGVVVGVLEENSASEFVPVQVVLWVPSGKVTDTDSNQSLTNPNASTDVCGYQPGKEPQDKGSKSCGSLKVVTPAIPFARPLAEIERTDETRFGSGHWRLAVIDAWVKRENLR